MIHLRPSSAHRWTRCAASPRIEANSPVEPDSDAAREGTCAAWVADCVLKNQFAPCADMNGMTHENGWLVTPDMTAHVQGYVNLIRSYGGTVSAEQFVRLTDFIGGTLDTSIAAEIDRSNTLRIKDLKYGMMLVEVYENPQVIIYAGAELIRLGSPPHITHVELAIYQPRAYHPEGIHRTWTMTVAELWERVNWIVARGNDCQRVDAPATPGPQCDHCSGRASCAALAFTNYRNYEVIQDTRQRHMTAAELTNELNFLDTAYDLIKARKSAVEAEALQRIRTEHIAGWTVETGKGNRVLKFDAETVKVMTGVDPTDPKLCTPAELERRGVPPEMVNALSRRPDTVSKLKRMNGNYLKKLFST